MTENKKLSAVVIMKNEELAIEKCLISLVKECKRTFHTNSYELIIVDSSSSDNSVGIALNVLEKLDVECYLVLKVDSNRFTAALGREIGRRYASGEWLLFLDGDMIIFQGFLGKALDYMNSKLNSNIIGLVGNRIDVFPNQESKKVLNYSRIIEPDGTTTHPGGGLLIKRSAFQNASYIIEQRVIEEELFASTLKARGLSIAYLDTNMYIHYNYKLPNRNSWFKFIVNYVEYGRSLALHVKKNCRHSGISELWRILGNRTRPYILAPLLFSAVFSSLVYFRVWTAAIICISIFLLYMRRKILVFCFFIFFLIQRTRSTRVVVKTISSKNDS